MFASLFAKTQAQPQRNYSRLVIISDFHYPCKNLVPPKERLMRMAAKERVLQEMNDWRDLDLAVFTGDMVQRNGDAAEYRLVRLVVNGLKKRKAFIAGNHELLYTGHHGELAPWELHGTDHPFRPLYPDLRPPLLCRGAGRIPVGLLIA